VDLLTTLPDVPRWVEARGMLLSGRGTAVECDGGDPVTVVAAPSVLLAVVVRWNAAEALGRALARVPGEFSIVCPAEAESAIARLLPQRSREPATLFHLPPAKAGRLSCSAQSARLLTPEEYAQLENLPPVLRSELRDACAYSPIASAFADDRPVSFCYSGWETETHWDVSIDTLEGYRRRGMAAAASACLIDHCARADKTAVWGSLASNPASASLARKLGFVEVDRLVLLYPDDRHEGGHTYSHEEIGL
jgi:RimJ/RimL family protein N-acetyltransferase